MMEALSARFGRGIAALAFLGCLLLLAMMLIIVADVALRNFAIPGGPQGLSWSNEVSELMLYLITMCGHPGCCARASTSGWTFFCRPFRLEQPGLWNG